MDGWANDVYKQVFVKHHWLWWALSPVALVWVFFEFMLADRVPGEVRLLFNLLAMIGALVTFYFIWAQRKTPILQLEPVEPTSNSE